MVVSQFKTIDGKTYYFQGDGSLCRDGVFDLDSNQYYFDANGVMQTNFEYHHRYFGDMVKLLRINGFNLGTNGDIIMMTELIM